MAIVMDVTLLHTARGGQIHLPLHCFIWTLPLLKCSMILVANCGKNKRMNLKSPKTRKKAVLGENSQVGSQRLAYQSHGPWLRANGRTWQKILWCCWPQQHEWKQKKFLLQWNVWNVCYKLHVNPVVTASTLQRTTKPSAKMTTPTPNQNPKARRKRGNSDESEEENGSILSNTSKSNSCKSKPSKKKGPKQRARRWLIQ